MRVQLVGQKYKKVENQCECCQLVGSKKVERKSECSQCVKGRKWWSVSASAVSWSKVQKSGESVRVLSVSWK